MNKFNLKDKIDQIIYITYNLLAEIFFQFNFKVKKKIKKNLFFKNKHKGERCFIIGTGPSLNKLNEAQVISLNKEVVFGANSFYKAKAVNSINPTYYALVDNLYWEEKDYTFTEVIKKYEQCPPTFITDLRAQGLAEKAYPEKQHVFVYSKKYPTVKVSEKIDSNIYVTMNVISCCILVAIYMGFKEIYLIGCDYSAFCNLKEEYKSDDKHPTFNLAFYLKFYWITTEFHYLIAKLAIEKNINIVNLSQGSLLDAYPMGVIDKVINRYPKEN